jgi:hypothetical protein
MADDVDTAEPTERCSGRPLIRHPGNEGFQVVLRRPHQAARDRLPAASRVSARRVVAALALLAGPGLTACSSPPPAPPRQPVGVETSVATRHYPVRGTTTAAIFAAIDANGLVEASGQRAVGMTSVEPVDAEIRRLDTELANLRRQVDAGRADLVAQHNALAGRRGALAEEHHRLVADANGLIDALNWARW